MTDDPISLALSALDDAGEALVKLEKTCCRQETRSPRMVALMTSFAAIEGRLGEASGDEEAAAAVLVAVDDAGAEIGRLQVTCCAPVRMALYARLLEDLNNVQRAVKKSHGHGH
jgi:hypothetical protein